MVRTEPAVEVWAMREGVVGRAIGTMISPICQVVLQAYQNSCWLPRPETSRVVV